MRVKILLGLALAALLTTAFLVRQTDSIYIVDDEDQPHLKIRSAAQTQPWLDFGSQTQSVFTVPASGIIAVANGGTAASSGSNALSNLGIQTGTCTTRSDGKITNTFATAFSASPKVICVQIGDDTTLTNTLSVTPSNFSLTVNKASVVANWVAIGTP